ncbi:LacI family DNA-binding transcriptional regulator [Humibacter ginsengiterrae]
MLPPQLPSRDWDPNAGPEREPTTSSDEARKRVSIRDVARAAGVAPSTVSRALSLPHRVNQATRLHIEHTAAQLGYERIRPEPQAHRKHAVAVVVSDVTNPFYFGIIRGTQHQLAAAGWIQLLVDTEESPSTELQALNAIAGRADGAVISASRLSDQRIAEIAERLPLVVINRKPRGVPSVLIDTPGGMEQALQHLVSLGHRNILYVAGPDSSWSNERRFGALNAAAKRLNLSLNRIGPHVPFVDSGAAAADAALNTDATACVAFNDLLAIGMLERFRERGVRVPEDMSVVGCDDIFGAAFCHPPLTTLTSPIEQAGRVAIRSLLHRIETGSVVDDDDRFDDLALSHEIVLATHLTVRESTGPAPSSVRESRR